MESFHVILHIAAALNWELHQIDIKTAFLYGLLDPSEVCYMEQPDGFEESGKEDWVWELQKGLYGMKQGGHVWNKTMNTHMEKLSFTHLPCEYYIYFHKTDLGTIIADVHVDDFIIAVSSTEAATYFKNQIHQEWQISDLGEAHFCIGIAISHDHPSQSIAISQTALIDHIISQFGISDAHPITTPMDPSITLSRNEQMTLLDSDKSSLGVIPYRPLIRCLMYLAVAT